MKLDWSKIDTVLLDMDGTLLDLHYDNYFWRQHLPSVIATDQGISAKQALHKLEPLFEKHAGTLNWYCVNFWSEQLGLDIMKHKREVASKIAYRPNAQEFLSFCRNKIADVRLVTNAHRKVLNLKIEHTQIDQFFDQTVCSHELGEPKESVSFWQNLNHQKTFEPARTLFIDDNLAMLESAKNYGVEYLFGITKPDSQNPAKRLQDFQTLDVLSMLS